METEYHSVNPEIQNVLYAIVIILKAFYRMVDAMRPKSGCVPFDERISQQFLPFLGLDSCIKRLREANERK